MYGDDPNKDWYDVSVVGSRYEEQTSYSGKYRHRYNTPGTWLYDFGDFYDDETHPNPWMQGPAPKTGITKKDQGQ